MMLAKGGAAKKGAKKGSKKGQQKPTMPLGVDDLKNLLRPGPAPGKASKAKLPAKRGRSKGAKVFADIRQVENFSFVGNEMHHLFHGATFREVVGLTYTNNDYGKGLAESVKANFTKIGGKITISAAHEDGKGDYSAEVAALAAAGGDILIVAGYLDQGGKGIIQASLDSDDVSVAEDGPAAEVDHLISKIEAIGRQQNAKYMKVSETEDERQRFWSGRKAAFPAVGRLSPDYLCMDGTIPRGQLSHVLTRMGELSEKYGLRVANVFHAGDGNLHPLILFDANESGELEAAEKFGADILRLCVEVGGVLTGEHGVGVEKRDLMGEMFTEDDMKHQQRVKCAFDPGHLLNPGKVYPTLHRCAELGKMHIHHGQVPFPDIPRF